MVEFIDPPIVGESYRMTVSGLLLLLHVDSVAVIDGLLRISLRIDTQGGKLYVIGDSCIGMTAAEFTALRQTGLLVRAMMVRP